MVEYYNYICIFNNSIKQHFFYFIFYKRIIEIHDGPLTVFL